jgi:PAS domain S-box-containing protein
MFSKKYSPAIIALTYFLFGSAWILFSERILQGLKESLPEYFEIETVKGIFFVFCSTLLIFFVSKYLTRKSDALENKVENAGKAFRSLFEIAPLGYAVIDTSGTIYMSNSYMNEMLGTGTEKNSRVANLIPDEQVEKFKNAIAKFSDPQTNFIVTQQQFRCKNGKIISGLLNISRMTFDNTTKDYLLLSLQDITSENEMLKELSMLHRELSEMRKEGKIGRWELELESQYVSLSDDMHEIFSPVSGIHKESLPKLFTILNENERIRLEEILEHSLKNRTPLEATFYFDAPGKPRAYFFVKGEFTISIMTGKEIISGTMRDVTQEVELMNEKEEMHKNLLNWCFMISHHIRKPISTFGGLNSVLHGKEIVDPELIRILSYLDTAYAEMEENTRNFGNDLFEKQKSLSESISRNSFKKSA